MDENINKLSDKENQRRWKIVAREGLNKSTINRLKECFINILNGIGTLLILPFVIIRYLYLSFCLNVFNKYYMPYDQSFEYDDFFMREHFGCKFKKITVDKHH